MSVSRGASKSANITNLPTEVQQSIFLNLTPVQIASLATLTTSTTSVIHDNNLWARISKRHLGIVPADPSPIAVRRLAEKLMCRWWLLTGLFVPGVPVHRRSGFCEVTARGGIELPIVHPEKESCYVFGGQHASAAIPVINPSVSLCFFMDPTGPVPAEGMRLSLVHTVEIPEDDLDLSYLNIGPAAKSEDESVKCEEPYASITVRVNNSKLLTSFRPKPGNFQVTHVHVPSDLLVTKPRMNHISVEYSPSSTAAYWLKDVSIMPSILPPPPEENTVTKIRIGEPLPEPQPGHPQETQPESPPSPRRHNQSRNRNRRHMRPIRRIPDDAVQQHLCEVHQPQRFQKVQYATTKPKHMYHHNYFRSPRRSSPTSPRARFTR